MRPPTPLTQQAVEQLITTNPNGALIHDQGAPFMQFDRLEIHPRESITELCFFWKNELIHSQGVPAIQPGTTLVLSGWIGRLPVTFS